MGTSSTKSPMLRPSETSLLTPVSQTQTEVLEGRAV
uniref:Uncharacterized protein n=1 Tax=Anguilla anguilla TaxID=7936 RepID=A0A0E9PWF7_ANGAN